MAKWPTGIDPHGNGIRIRLYAGGRLAFCETVAGDPYKASDLAAAVKRREELAARLGITDVSLGNLFSSRLALQKQRDALLAALRQVDECFEAALAEGWVDALANGDIDRLRDLYSRRIYYARAIAVNAIAAAT